MSHSYFVVEGPHDVEVIGCLLKRRGYARVQLLEKLDPYWHDLIPRTYPIDGDLLRRVPTPTFFANASQFVAVHSAIGLERISKTLRATLHRLDVDPDGLGIVLDADFDVQPFARWESVTKELASFDFGQGPGRVGQGTPRAGIYVLPDNQSPGTLEDVLLECAATVYPHLASAAAKFVNPIDPTDKDTFPNDKDSQDFRKPTGKSKAIAGCIANILRPGKAIQVSIQDNQWLQHDQALQLPRVASLQRFVDGIIGLTQA